MMGSPFSKKPNPPMNGSSRDNGSSSNSSDKSSHEAGNHQDPELQNLDSILQQRTIGAISMLMSSEANSISFDTFRQITGCLLDNNHEVVNIILEYKKDVWKNPELFDLVQEYFANSLQTLEFCSSLEKCLKRARDSQLIIQLALRQFEEEEGNSEEEGNGKKKYERTLEELQHFKAAGDPFTDEFFRVFQSVCMKQFSMFEKLKKKKEKLDRKLRSVKAWRRVSSIIFVSAFATVLICSVVAAVMAAPPVAAALAAAASIPLGSVGKWVDSLWKNYSKVLKGQKDVFITMEVATFVAVGDLEDIRVLVNRLEIHMSSLVENVDFALGDAEAVKFGIEEMEKKLGEFMRSVERLGKQVDRCSRNIQRARTIVLEKIRLPE